MKKIITTEAPLPAGHYSQAISYNGLVFVSGQLPLDPKTGKIVTGGIEAQLTQTIENIRSILSAANSTLDRVLKTNIYITDINHWAEINRVYAEIFGEHKPARAIIPCGSLHLDALLEMEVIAATIETAD